MLHKVKAVGCIALCVQVLTADVETGVVLDPREWRLADHTYQSVPQVLCTLRSVPSNTAFANYNTLLSTHRLVVEQLIGSLKKYKFFRVLNHCGHPYTYEFIETLVWTSANLQNCWEDWCFPIQ